MLYDPANGWRYGFPKEYKPLKGEPLDATLVRDGYPQAEIDNGGGKYVRFMGERSELDTISNEDGIIFIDENPHV